MIRDAAYDAIPKSERAILHEGFARWLEGIAGERVAEQEEILGYHLEQAVRLRGELGRLGGDGSALAATAAAHLGSAGRRSYARGDTAGAINLLSRAIELRPDADPERVRDGIELARALAWGGEEARAVEMLEGVSVAASAIEDLVLQTHVSLALTEFGGWRDARGWEGWKPDAERAIEVFEPIGDDAGLARAWSLLAWDHNVRNHYARKDEAVLRALGHAEATGDRALVQELLTMWMGSTWGPVTVTDGLARCDEAWARSTRERWFEAETMVMRSVLIAMRGELEQARTLYGAGKAITDELGKPMASAFAVQEGWYIQMIAGDFALAESLTRAEYARLREADSLALQDITRDMMALALIRQGRFEEADALALETGQQLMSLGDVTMQNVWRRVHALALAARGAHEEAVRLARTAEALFDGTDALIDHGEALLDLAEVLRAAGRVTEAAGAADDALALYEQKENVVEAARARRFRDELTR